ncbi:TrfB-related DNA-binding protein [Variovorax saccharolyticus]|uniref:TrfB-related DNA-binding protein n=1 Tax=Variovorax saccharolyticus TaxID=3053516 RepID=UPI002577930F|nr:MULTISPECIES: TrfB-related DNA-binding protein [unclassified Variovorax]MDM0022695.1 TrfB-related DNA-binding protein [Variovorax sp. J22R187]MDM0030367.1 TrfB-related DNA-binding protein [Variovorax sp. J31P216]
MTVVDRHLLDRVARERRFDDRTMQIARRLFLEGHKPKRLATEYGVIHQRIYAIRRLVQAAVNDFRLPEGWTEVTLQGPADLVHATAALFDEQMRMREGSDT